jgi:heme-degrading monooxygenase HmoA
MIIRRWHAVADDQRGYLAHFRRKVLPALRSVNGFEGALVLRRRTGTQVEIEVLTFWRSMSAIRRFAGHDIERAVVENEAKTVLRSFSRRVQHFEVMLDARPMSRRTGNQTSTSRAQPNQLGQSHG